MNKKVSVISILTAGFLSSCGTYMAGTRDESIQQTLNPEIGDQNLLEIERLKHKIKNKDTEITSLRWKYMKNLQKKENELKQKQDELNELNAKHETAKNKIAEQEQTIADLNRNFEVQKQALEAEIENKKQEIAQLKTNFNNQKAELENTKNTLMQKEQKITELQAKIVKLIEKSWSYAIEIKKRDKKITELQSQLTAKTQELEGKIRDLEAEKQTLLTKIDTIKEDRDNLQTQLNAKNQEIGTLTTQKQNLENQLNNIRAERDGLQTQLNTQNQEIQTLKNNKQYLENRLNSVIAARNRYEADYERTQNELKKIIKELNNIKQELKTALEDSANKTRQLVQKNTLLSAKDDLIEQLRGENNKNIANRHREWLYKLYNLDSYNSKCAELYCMVDKGRYLDFETNESFKNFFKVNPSSSGKTIYNGVAFMRHTKDFKIFARGNVEIGIANNTGHGDVNITANLSYASIPGTYNIKYKDLDFTKPGGFYNDGSSCTYSINGGEERFPSYYGNGISGNILSENQKSAIVGKFNLFLPPHRNNNELDMLKGVFGVEKQ